MDTRELEAVVRTAWASSQLPLTDAVLARLSGMPRADIEHGMRQLMRKGVVDMDVGPDGAIQWCVPGLKRELPPPPPPPQGPVVESTASPAVSAAPAALAPVQPPAVRVQAAPAPERVLGDRISMEVPGTALRIGVEQDGAVRLGTDPEKKSLLMSGGLSLVFGPFGWMYAGHWKEVVPAIAIYVGLVAVFPTFLLGALLGLLHPACGVLGTLYAWRFNKLKERTPLLLVSQNQTPRRM